MSKLTRAEDVKGRRWRDQHATSQDGLCRWCYVKMTPDGNKRQVTLDHLISRALGGAHSFDNTCAACGKCNRKKGDMPLDQWLESKWLDNRRNVVLLGEGRGPPEFSATTSRGRRKARNVNRSSSPTHDGNPDRSPVGP